MLTHSDDDAMRAFMGRLGERAEESIKTKASEITTGKPGEEPVDSWSHGRIHVTKLPDDEQSILRVSIGGGTAGLPRQADMDYCVFRGDRTQCAYLLEQAAAALREGHQL